MLLSYFHECIWMLLWNESCAQERWLAAGNRRSVSKKVLGGCLGLPFPILCQ